MGNIKGFLFIVIVIGGGILLLGAVGGGGWYLAAGGGGAEINLPLIIIGGVILLLTALGLLTHGFSIIDLTNRDEALGLPSGSVRAVIALMLLVIFAIVAIFMYNDVASSGKLQRLENVSERILTDLKQNVAVVAFEPMESQKKGEPGPKEPQPNPPEEHTDAKPEVKTPPLPPARNQKERDERKKAEAKKKADEAKKKADEAKKKAEAAKQPVVYRVWYRDAVSGQGADIAKQLIVLLGTLVTAVASFYFGSSSIAAATKQRDRVGAPDAKAVTPRELKPNTPNQPLTITGTNLGNVVGVQLMFDGQDPIIGEGVSASDAKVECKVTTKANTKAGPWTVEVSDNANNASKIPNIITVAVVVPEILTVTVDELIADDKEHTVTVTGRNLADVDKVKFEPPDGITVGTPKPDSSGTQLTFTVKIAGARPPDRKLTLVNKAAESKPKDVTLKRSR
jgi:hypothetical protein